MKDKLQYISKFRNNISLVSVNELEINEIPSPWLEILKVSNLNNQLKKVIDLWNSISGKELRNTISYLSQNLVDIDLIKYNDKYSILYTINVGDGEIDYFEGNLPTQKINNTKLEKVWPCIPDSVKSFYEHLHDGFYYYPSMAMGLVSLDKVVSFEDDEWGIIDDLQEPLGIDLHSTYGFFSSGMGGYVAIDLKNCKDDNATIWFTDEQPRYHVNFWDVVDEWIVIGFE
ncbi:MAG: hypothetical protein K0R31_1562 [Clostridiales bacterium]|jgi:hypothetical protein|nr:hypothetical protein [Clostridiales bacterium]MDF2596762.1 hypothetical protein [Clostridia bacterium]MDF2791363.1 hypothetical protein [Neobacillus sp.]